MALSQPSPGEKELRNSFEARLPGMLERAKAVNLPAMIPDHWFSSAASECAEMYVGGHFYGAISVAQAYVEALGLYLAETQAVRHAKEPCVQWERLVEEKVVSRACGDAACAVYDRRNDFHHLKKTVETEYRALEERAGSAVKGINRIEAEIFECSASATPGVIEPKNPRYWPSDGPGTARVFLRQVW